jgi:hypothetical protein
MTPCCGHSTGAGFARGDDALEVQQAWQTTRNILLRLGR